MNAKELAILGAIGVGAYVLLRPSTASDQPPPVPRPPDLPPPMALPARVGTTPVPPAGTNVVAKPNELHPQFWYAGRADLFGTPAMNLPDSWLVGALTSAGFGGSSIRPDAPEAAGQPRAVLVFHTPQDAKAFGFADWALTDPGVGTRWFYGRWTGEVPAMTLPDLIKLLWRANAPQTR